MEDKGKKLYSSFKGTDRNSYLIKIRLELNELKFV